MIEEPERVSVGQLAHAAPASYPYRLRYPALDVRRLENAASIKGEITTPWRVIMIGSSVAPDFALRFAFAHTTNKYCYDRQAGLCCDQMP